MLKLTPLPQTGSIANRGMIVAEQKPAAWSGWAKPVFLLLAFAATGVILGLRSAFLEMGTLELAFLVLLAPAVLIIAFFAIPQGLQNLHSQIGKLVWWHWLWLLILLSTFVFRIRDAEMAASEPIDVWALMRLLPEAIVAFYLLMRLVDRRSSWPRSLFRGLLATLAVYGLVCAASALWSVKPSWTLYKSCEYLLDVSVLAAALTAIHSTETYESLFNWVWTLCGFELMLTWIGAILWPNEAWEAYPTRLIGVYPVQASNAVGASGAILAVIAFSRLFSVPGRRTQRSWYAAVLAFGIASMLASKTRVAIAGFVVGALLVLLFSKRAKMAVMLTAASGAVMALAAVFMGALSNLSARSLVGHTFGIAVNFLEREQTTDQLESLTGRVQWWEFAWQQFSQHPFTGLGAYAGGKFAVLSKLGFGDTAHLHSDYLEAIVGASFWALIPLLMAVVGTWWLLIRFLRRSDLKPFERQLVVEAIGVLGILTIRSFFNTEFVWHAPQYFLAILGYAELLRRRASAATL